MCLESILLIYLIYFLIILIFWVEVAWQIVMMTPSFSKQIKSAMVFELAFLRCLLMLIIRKLAWFKITSVLLLLIETITCFLKSFFVVMLVFGLTMFDFLIMLLISMILLEDRAENAFLICKISLTLIFKVWVYNFLLLMDLDKKVCMYDFLLLIVLVNLLLFDLDKSEGDIRVLEAVIRL